MLEKCDMKDFNKLDAFTKYVLSQVDETPVLIANQKTIAKELLNKMEVIDPYAILAGGCPRDWYFNKVANDLDFYVHIKAETMQATELRMKRLGLDISPMSWESNDEHEYKCMEHLHAVWDGVYKGQKFQVMVMNESTFTSVVNKFGSSVCMAWWKGGKVEPTLPFLLSHHMKVIFLKDDYTAKEKHVAKMVARYPDYNVLGYDKFESIKHRFAMKENIYPTDGSIFERLSALT